MSALTNEEILAKLREINSDSFAKYCGIVPELTEDGQLRMTIDLEAHHMNPYGTAHGGLLYTLLDNAAGSACQIARGFRGRVATQSSSIYYIRPGISGKIHAECTILHMGRQTSVVHVDILNEQGKLICSGESSLFHFDA